MVRGRAAPRSSALRLQQQPAPTQSYERHGPARRALPHGRLARPDRRQAMMNMQRNRTASGSERVRVAADGLRCVTNTRSLPLAVLLLCLSPFICMAQTSEQSPLPAPPIQRPANPKLPAVFVVGDSTANNSANGAQGWGDPFVSFFDTSKLNVLNRARAGRSSRTFLTE